MFGGTFDPVHHGHLRSAVELSEALGLDRLHMIPAHVPPHREAPGVSSDQRLSMLRLGVEGAPGLVADDRELRREGPSYSVDTLASLREEYGPRARLIMMLGHDAFLSLHRWYQPQRLFELAHLVVVDRPDHEDELPQAVRALVEGREARSGDELMQSPRGGWLRLALPSRLAISATHIRQCLLEERSVRYLLPLSVIEHIQMQGLYSGLRHCAVQRR
ncbi:nicotinate-nucleotide adenylyltransferase [Pistricoccus aurantiacus]|uniref:Probable nicotinate-nucleotide adenylyltransferase n=1 Tax=Pistricoccus aurantiacus TaxID=1883414 RepID=A0A5B8SWE4_9GAMM|nr:nicotinate-nucleotide adenylyltransferase [Pistricoccus aurantiacus]QEA40976.1 nicotinate-nucleotide adenylyltransferase [Pistricoccus aurantiacus]